MPEWSWSLQDAEGSPVEPAVAPPAEGFSAQADAETWVGEHWRALAAGGAHSAALHRDGARVYDGLSLRPGG